LHLTRNNDHVHAVYMEQVKHIVCPKLLHFVDLIFQGHGRMVYSTAWSPDTHGKCSLYSAGFDAKVIGWKMADVKA